MYDKPLRAPTGKEKFVFYHMEPFLILLQADVGRAKCRRIWLSCLLSSVGEGEVCSPGDTNSRHKGLDTLLSDLQTRATNVSGRECTHELELNRHQTEVDDLHRRPNCVVGLQGWHVHVTELRHDSTSATALSNGHDAEEAGNTYQAVSTVCKAEIELIWRIPKPRFPRSWCCCRGHVPNGAKMIWSKATLFIAGPKALVLVIGKVLDRNPNHLNCNGAMAKPYAMNLVRRSKSNGGGRALEPGISSRSVNGSLTSSS